MLTKDRLRIDDPAAYNPRRTWYRYLVTFDFTGDRRPSKWLVRLHSGSITLERSAKISRPEDLEQIAHAITEHFKKKGFRWNNAHLFISAFSRFED
ncbi:MAG TPA: hypothetical protein VEB18_01185 [Candidatus Paceibacterota bacterium]|nr:hypothetical protein [Candidatus Paceibacterota bacterium]